MPGNLLMTLELGGRRSSGWWWYGHCFARCMLPTSLTRLLAGTALVLGLAPSVFAQAIIPLTISGREATGVIDLPGGVGAELSITFEEVVGLNPSALEVSAGLVGPLDLPALLA